MSIHCPNQNPENIIALINSSPETITIDQLKQITWLFDEVFEEAKQKLIEGCY